MSGYRSVLAAMALSTTFALLVSPTSAAELSGKYTPEQIKGACDRAGEPTTRRDDLARMAARAPTAATWFFATETTSAQDSIRAEPKKTHARPCARLGSPRRPPHLREQASRRRAQSR